MRVVRNTDGSQGGGGCSYDAVSHWNPVFLSDLRGGDSELLVDVDDFEVLAHEADAEASCLSPFFLKGQPVHFVHDY